MYFKTFLLFLAGFIGLPAMSQMIFINDTVHLNEVTVRSSRLEEYSIGSVVESPDSLLVKTLQAASLAELLTLSTGVSIKTYGQGGVASVSIRGGGSAHTAVLWNGINIQSPMNSGVNLSTMPLTFINDVKIQSGGAGTLYGSGAMSGVIHLSGKNLFREGNGVETNVGYGSFKTKSALARIKQGCSNRAFAITVFGNKSKNDFEFINTARMDNRREKQTNAGFLQYGIMKETHFRLSEKSLITSSVWYQHFDKDVQTLMTNSKPNRQNQLDNNVLGAVNFKYYGDNYTLNIKQGAVLNDIAYTDKAMHSNSGESQSLAMVSEAELRLNLNEGHIWNTGINYTANKGESDNYDKIARQHRFAVFSFLQFYSLNNRLTSVVSVRDEMSDGTLHPMVMAFGSDYKLGRHITWQGNIARNYRIPAFNDTFWGGDIYAKGNPGLRPEYGWSGDTGLKFHKTTDNIHSELTATFFASKIYNWIVWLQNEKAVWMPFNKKTGESKGVEVRWGNSLNSGKSVFKLSGSWNYTSSRMSTDNVYDGTQMLYVPRHQASTLLSWKQNQFETLLAINAVGKRYYDYTNALDAYVTGNIFLNYLIPASFANVSLNMKIRNIWDTHYQVTAWYAMPMRNYEFAINLRF